MPPEAVVTMLREFHERMTAQIFACGGTVEKYIGDAIFAVFGLPTASPHDAANALRCADLMLDELDGLERRARAEQGEPPLAIGIGLNYGPAVLGDVGSEHSLSFTVIGDTVNIASRLQGLTRELKTPLVVADAVVQPDRRRPDRQRPTLPVALHDRRRARAARPQRHDPHLDSGGGVGGGRRCRPMDKSDAGLQIAVEACATLARPSPGRQAQPSSLSAMPAFQIFVR